VNQKTAWILAGVVLAFILWRRRQVDAPTTGGGFGGKFPTY